MLPSRRRKVSSCIPCYTKKQKCNRQHPCNHCTRRRRPEDCAYYPSDEIQSRNSPTLQTGNHHEEYDQRNTRATSGGLVGSNTVSGLETNKGPTTNTTPSALTDIFGYSEDSQTNTMALLRRVQPHEEEGQNRSNHAFALESDSEIKECLDKVPDGAILDFLMKHFVHDVNWPRMDQLVHLPWILDQYELWRTVKVPSSVFEIEFAVLILRICSYTSEFLPSPSWTIESTRGMSLADIRHSCDEEADRLSELCFRLNPKGSLLRIQHLAFAGLKAKCEGQMNHCRDLLSSAIHMAQSIGADKDPSQLVPDMDEFEKETRRRIFCNLYIWDSHLSRQSDRIPILPDGIEPENMPRMHLGPDLDDAHDLEEFTERILQVRLANFWKSMGPALGSPYDVIVAEERYEKWCSLFLAQLPPAFALQPNKQWDERFPMLAQQREILHISMFESLCYNFRPTILLEGRHVQDLPKYKQVLLSSQRKGLAVAALYVLKGVSRLYSLMGGSQTRYTGIIQPTFEAAVILVSLCVDPSFLADVESHGPAVTKADPLRAGMGTLSRAGCMKAIRDAISRLQMLAEASNMADVGAQTLADLIRKMAKLSASTQGMEKASTPASASFTQARGSSSEITLPEYPDLDPTVSLAELVPVPGFDVDMNIDWDSLASEL